MNYSGKFVLRVDSALHKSIANKAQQRGISLNRLCSALIENGLRENKQEGVADFLNPALSPILKNLQEKFRGALVSLLAFGSRVSGQTTSASDLDLLIVLDDTIPIERTLYSWWEERISHNEDFEISPHFVHLPKQAMDAGSLWFEVALNHRTSWDPKFEATRFIEKIRRFISEDKIRRYWSHGHPYWVRTAVEK